MNQCRKMYNRKFKTQFCVLCLCSKLDCFLNSVEAQHPVAYKLMYGGILASVCLEGKGTWTRATLQANYVQPK